VISRFSHLLSRIPLHQLRRALLLAIAITIALLVLTSWLVIRTYPYAEIIKATVGKAVPVHNTFPTNQDAVRKAINAIAKVNPRIADRPRDAVRDRRMQTKSALRLISSQPYGRLGNVMFVYASMFGVARWTGRKPTLPSAHHFRDTFDITAMNFDHPADAPWLVPQYFQ